MNKFYITISTLFIFSFANAQFSLDVESGVAKFGYNDVSIPGKTGTPFSLSDDFKNDLSTFFRLRVQATIGKRHTISALYAPFTSKSESVINRDIFFENELFKAGELIHSTWKFNSYRLSYQYNFISNE